MKYTIYKTTNKINNKIYIGFHITDNPNDDYLGSGKILEQAIKKYGKDAFVKEILHIFNTPEEMFAKEAELVNEDFISRNDTYNIKLGGQGGWDWVNKNYSKERRQVTAFLGYEAANRKINLSKKGNDRLKELMSDPFYRKKHADKSKGRQFFLGKNHSDETKQRIGRANALKQQGKGNSQYGTCWITNGTENKKIKKETLDIWIKKGYNKGRI